MKNYENRTFLRNGKEVTEKIYFTNLKKCPNCGSSALRVTQVIAKRVMINKEGYVRIGKKTYDSKIGMPRTIYCNKCLTNIELGTNILEETLNARRSKNFYED